MLKKPLGRLIPSREVSESLVRREFEGCVMKVSVGDASTERLISLGFTPDVEVVDGREMREWRGLPESSFKTELRVSNPPGCISSEALKAVAKAKVSERPVRILVEGEEDLMTLPIIASYPDGAVVVYGQPGEGLVFIRLNGRIREVALSILREMGCRQIKN